MTKNNILIAGIGNRLKGDDGLGCEVIRRLREEPMEGVRLLDMGETPENFTSLIAELAPDKILFVDSVDAGREPGSYSLFSVDSIGYAGTSTHSTSLKLFFLYLRQRLSAEMFMLGIQPGLLRFGEEISSDLLKKINSITCFIRKNVYTLSEKNL